MVSGINQKYQDKDFPGSILYVLPPNAMTGDKLYLHGGVSLESAWPDLYKNYSRENPSDESGVFSQFVTYTGKSDI